MARRLHPAPPHPRRPPRAGLVTPTRCRLSRSPPIPPTSRTARRHRWPVSAARPRSRPGPRRHCFVVATSGTAAALLPRARPLLNRRRPARSKPPPSAPPSPVTAGFLQALSPRRLPPAPRHAPLLRLAARPGSSRRDRKASAATDRVSSSSLAPRRPWLTSPVGSGPAGSASRPPAPQLKRPTCLLAQNLQVNSQVLYSKSKDDACYGVSMQGSMAAWEGQSYRRRLLLRVVQPAVVIWSSPCRLWLCLLWSMQFNTVADAVLVPSAFPFLYALLHLALCHLDG